MLADHALLLGQLPERGLVGDRAPQPGRNGLLLDLLQARGDPGLAEILLRQHVGRRPATTRRAPRHRRHETPPSRRGCGSRSWSGGIRSPHRVTGRPWYSAARFASSCPFCPAASPRRRPPAPSTAVRPLSLAHHPARCLSRLVTPCYFAGRLRRLGRVRSLVLRRAVRTRARPRRTADSRPSKPSGHGGEVSQAFSGIGRQELRTGSRRTPES